jgi:hypothetical protein
MERSFFFYFFAMMLIAVTAFADVYKCVSEDGVVTFSDEPCGKKAEITIHSLSLDDLIGLASPFTQSIMDSNSISNDLLSHSRKLGKSILPKERYYGHNVSLKNDLQSYWEIRLYYAPKGFTEWEIRMDYVKKPKAQGYSLWLKSIFIKRWGKPYSPPTMQHAKKMRKIGPGEWVTRQ